MWYKGTVLSMNPETMEFEVEYEEEEDTYLFTLLDDITSLMNGNPLSSNVGWGISDNEAILSILSTGE